MKNLLITAVLTSAVASVAAAQTGRQLDIIGGITGVEPVASRGGEFYGVAPVVGIFWDKRCASVSYTLNAGFPANPGTANEISPEQLAATVQAGLDRWNANPSSYIEMNVTSVKDLGSRPRIGGDFINEITWTTAPTFNSLASSPSTSLPVDATFNVGDDLDGDGDSDVFDPAVAGIEVCTDIDNDGDIEFPAGDYKAGTILDNDVQFNPRVLWELAASDNGGADIDAVSTHEFGHSHGLNHALINQISAEDGTGSTMFPFIDTGDGASELGSRDLHIDDLAASAFIYPEGTAKEGIAALQEGDIAFDDAYDIVEGSVELDGTPAAGANVFVESPKDGQIVSGTSAGSTRIFVDIFDVDGDGDNTAAFAFPESVVDANYKLPVPARAVYRAYVEAVDGDPVSAGSISLNTIVADILGLTFFPEEGFDGRLEADSEFRPSLAFPFYSGSARAKEINFITNVEFYLSNFNEIDFGGLGGLADETSFIYAEKFDRAQLREFLALGDVPVSFSFLVNTFDASLVPKFARGSLALGRIADDGSVDIERTLFEMKDFVAQDGDFSPLYLRNARSLPFRITQAFNADPELELFALLEARPTVIGPSGEPPQNVGIELVASADADTSFLSLSGGPLLPLDSDLRWVVSLDFANDGSSVNPFLIDGATRDLED